MECGSYAIGDIQRPFYIYEILYHELLAQYDFRPRVEPAQTDAPRSSPQCGVQHQQSGRLGYPKVIYYDDLGDSCSEPLGAMGSSILLGPLYATLHAGKHWHGTGKDARNR